MTPVRVDWAAACAASTEVAGAVDDAGRAGWRYRQAADAANRARPGSTLYTTTVSVSRSGMVRTIKLIGVRDGMPLDLSHFAAYVLGWPMARDGSGVRVSGAGMDMGFHLVHSLGRHVWPDYEPYELEDMPYPYTQRWL